MTIATTTLAGLTFTANEKAAALGSGSGNVGYSTSIEDLRKLAIQSVLDASRAVKNLDLCLETSNKSAVDGVLTIIA